MKRHLTVAALCLVALALIMGFAGWMTRDERLILAWFYLSLAFVVVLLAAMRVQTLKMQAKLMRTLFSKKEFVRLAEGTPVRTLREYKSLGFRVASTVLAFGVAFLFASLHIADAVGLFLGGVAGIAYGIGGLLAARTFTEEDIDPAKTKKRLEYIRYVMMAGVLFVAWVVYVERDMRAFVLVLPLVGFGMLLYGVWRTVRHAFFRR